MIWKTRQNLTQSITNMPPLPPWQVKLAPKRGKCDLRPKSDQFWKWSGYISMQTFRPFLSLLVHHLCDAKWLHESLLTHSQSKFETWNFSLNSLAPGKFEWNFRYVIFKWILVIDGWGISCEIALLSMSLDFSYDKLKMVQVMAWCHQATNHYLSQCWPRSLSPYGITRPQWVNEKCLKVSPTKCCILTHWGRVLHIYASVNQTIIGSDNGLSPGQRQAILWTNAAIFLIGPLGINFSEILMEIQTFSFKKLRLKMSSAKWRPSCLGLNLLTPSPCTLHRV